MLTLVVNELKNVLGHLCIFSTALQSGMNKIYTIYLVFDHTATKTLHLLMKNEQQ